MTTEKEKTKTGMDVLEQAMRNYEQAFKAGMKVQEETAKWWGSVLTKAPTADAWQKKATALGEEAFPTLQKLTEESMRVIEQCSRSSLDLFKEGMEAARSTSLAEGQTRLQKLWEGSLQTLQANVQAVAHLNTRLMETCLDAARKGAELAETARA